MASITNINSTDLITDSRANLNDNFANLNADKLETSVLDTDTTLAANSDSKVATQKAVKAYVDAGGNINATETNKGIVEIATQAEVNAGTATGSTGASLAVTPATLAGGTVPVVNTYEVGDSPATWTKPAGLKYVVVEVQAAGGAGGSVTSAANSTSAAGGGGAGGYGKKLIPAASLGVSETVTVGAAGSNTSFGTFVDAVSGTAASGTPGGAGGTCTGGDVNITGGDGHSALQGLTTARIGVAGNGGDSFLGKGGRGAEEVGSSGNNGDAGYTYGGGGGGSLADNSTAATGGAGAAGVVIVTEYYV